MTRSSRSPHAPPASRAHRKYCICGGPSDCIEIWPAPYKVDSVNDSSGRTVITLDGTPGLTSNQFKGWTLRVNSGGANVPPVPVVGNNAGTVTVEGVALDDAGLGNGDELVFMPPVSPNGIRFDSGGSWNRSGSVQSGGTTYPLPPTLDNWHIELGRTVDDSGGGVCGCGCEESMVHGDPLGTPGNPGAGAHRRRFIAQGQNQSAGLANRGPENWDSIDPAWQGNPFASRTDVRGRLDERMRREAATAAGIAAWASRAETLNALRSAGVNAEYENGGLLINSEWYPDVETFLNEVAHQIELYAEAEAEAALKRACGFWTSMFDGLAEVVGADEMNALVGLLSGVMESLTMGIVDASMLGESLGADSTSDAFKTSVAEASLPASSGQEPNTKITVDGHFAIGYAWRSCGTLVPESMRLVGIVP